MRYLAYLGRRVIHAVLTVYAVVTVLVLAMYPVVDDFVSGQIAEIRYLFRVNDITAIQKRRLIRSVREQYGVEKTLPERLVDWWYDVPTLDWGDSVLYQEPVTAVLDGRLLRTLEYVLPGFLLAVGLGVALGLAIAVLRNTVLDWSARLTAYGLLGVPVFALLLYLDRAAGATVAGVALPDPGPKALAALGVAVSLLAGQLRYTRASSLEQASQTFVKTLRAKGIGSVGLARHLLRNVALPLVSLSIAELLGTLVLAVYVIESVVEVRGLGAVTLRAVRRADLPLVVGSALLVVFLGVALSLLQDLLSGYLDPRIRAE
ncbi:ABC transporter permease [Halobacteriales archaeon Cl-PHB]